MIIAVNKCPQNITLKAFNLSPQIYIYYLCFNFPENGWVSTCLLECAIMPILTLALAPSLIPGLARADINLGPRAPTLVEMGFYMPSLIPDLARADIKLGPRAPTLVYLHARA